MKNRKITKNYGVKFGIIFISLVVIVISIIGIYWNAQNKKRIPKPDVLEIATQAEKNKKKQEIEWNLVLVNKEHAISEEYTIELAKIDSQRKFDKRAIGYLLDMIETCREEGNKEIWAQSTYRPIQTQKKLYENKITYYQNKGYALGQAEELAQTIVNKPGHSEHNLGLAVDFNTVDNRFENTKEFRWLQKHAEQYGFILRYPKEKEEITKVTYEPWHWRYVGQEHAKKINENQWCLEEYIKYLSEEESEI